MRKPHLTENYKIHNILLLIILLSTPLIILKILGVSLIFFFSIIFGWVTPIILYFITGYNLLLLVIGYFKKLFKPTNLDEADYNKLPTLSIIIPVKNEEHVVGRLLKRITELNYPKEKLEVIIVEDGSTDNTKAICEEYAQKHDYIKVYTRDRSVGKPDAIEFGCQKANGEIIGVFDADSLPEKDLLIKAVNRLNNPGTAAVQGRLKALNISQTPLAEISDYEMRLNQLIAAGRNDLNLFVQLYGTNQFIKRSILQEVGSWNIHALAEDQEISIRLYKKGYYIKIFDGETYQENPANIRQFLKQRLRWYTGGFQNLRQHFNAPKNIKVGNKLVKFDIALYLLNPFFTIMGTLCLLFGIPLIFLQAPLIYTLELVLYAFIALNICLFAWAGLLAVKTRNPRKLLLAPYLYIYWFLIFLATSWALIKTYACRRLEWVKTDKTGAVTERKFLES
ncbi:MAG: glycosyltransferase family 2 protein [Candidatus Odinarchaeum yellowstonii]|uniref:Glycosyltransferase family 2 protein n=1 Tax=Odinarchaeota yellowstonii (strain LCB_4) TaxID=1841599 RepID=A0AAF0D2L9_ODILC|nr:MAG: glycosyltransferase family 2 protein [Candidatus Odinarchaeum yellowstonii]